MKELYDPKKHGSMCVLEQGKIVPYNPEKHGNKGTQNAYGKFEPLRGGEKIYVVSQD